MRKEINGIMYDTEDADCVASYHPESSIDSIYYNEHLYRANGENYFLHLQIFGKLYDDPSKGDHRWWHCEEIVPCTEHEADAWCGERIDLI